ncbi:MAG: iron-sulfur cluster assembly accessory protein [Nodosilinea sp.]
MIHIRPAAVQEIQRLLARQASSGHQRPQAYLSLASGGCAEWTYQLTAEPPEAAATAVAIPCDDISLAVAAKALDLIEDLTIDYAEDLMGGGFRFTNPIAQRTCGCGSAFSLSADAVVTQDCTGGLPTG